MQPYIQAKLEHNVHVIVGKPRDDGTIAVRENRRFKNTATRLMTESICEYLAGDENSYNRGHGRPNFMGFGTMGIRKQGNLNNPLLEPQFEDTNPPAQDRTRPWFESTSLALTDTCGETVTVNGVNPHFWNPEYGWGTSANPNEPVFEGELCTAMKPADAQTWKDNGWEIIQRVPILRADVISDCPQDMDYGIDGYSSSVIFYGYASVLWVNNLLNPKQKKKDALESEPQTEPVGPQLDRMAISEFGLYEKNNTDPHGLHTLLAGFRVPSADDIVYVYKNEVILVEWRVTVRALMPYEGVRVVTEPAPTGLNIYAEYLGETPTQDKQVQFTGVVRGDAGVRQGITWSIDNNPDYDSRTQIDDNGMLIVGRAETQSVIYVTGASIVDPYVLSKTAVLTGLIKDFVTGINLTTQSVSTNQIQFNATVLGRGSFGTGVTWTMTGAEKPGTTMTQTGLLTLDFEETADALQVTVRSNADTQIYSAAAVVRIDKTAGTYVISDFTLLTEGGD